MPSVSTIPQIIAPRFVVNAIAAVFTFAVGVVTAVVTSGVLIGWPEAKPTIVGSILVALYLVFVVALVALIGSLVRKVPATALLTVGGLIVLSLVGLLKPLEPWLPSYLVGGFDGVIAGGDFVYWRAVVVTVAAVAVALWIATVRLSHREV